MKIRLIRTGGLLPLKKTAEDDINWTKADMHRLKEASQPAELPPASVRDGVTYSIEYDDQRFILLWEKIPEKYKEALESLKYKLASQKL